MFEDLKKEYKAGIYVVAIYWFIVLATLVFALINTDKWSGGYQYVPFILVTTFPYVTFLTIGMMLTLGINPLENQIAIAGAIGWAINSTVIFLFTYGLAWLLNHPSKKAA